jgi:hypothetical protein
MAASRDSSVSKHICLTPLVGVAGRGKPRLYVDSADRPPTETEDNMMELFGSGLLVILIGLVAIPVAVFSLEFRRLSEQPYHEMPSLLL